MLWKLEYSDYRIKSELAHGKKDAFSRAFRTLLSYPYLSVDIYKFSGDEKIYFGTYEMETRPGRKRLLVEKRR